MMKSNKKANIPAIGMLITLITGVAAALLALIFLATMGGQTFNLVESDINTVGYNLVSNQSINLTLSNGQDNLTHLGHAGIYSNNLTLSNVSIANNLDLSGNVIVDYDAGTIQLINASLNATEWYASYAWGAEGMREKIGTSIMQGFETIETSSGYMPVMVLAFVIFIVLTLVFSMSGLTGNKGFGGAL